MCRIVDCGHFLTAVACGGWLWQSLPGRAYSFLDIFLVTTYPRSCLIWWSKNQFTWGLMTAAKSLPLCYLPRGQLISKTGPQLEVGWRLQGTSVWGARVLGTALEISYHIVKFALGQALSLRLCEQSLCEDDQLNPFTVWGHCHKRLAVSCFHCYGVLFYVAIQKGFFSH